MRIFKYILSVWTAILIYIIFSFLAGHKGLSSYYYLLAEKEQQLVNIKELGLINEELEKNRNNLLYDHDTLLVHARNLGYGYENERYVRIVGLGNNKSARTEIGNIYIAQKPQFLDERTIKIAAICSGLLVFAFFLTMELILSKQ